jgi:transcriptional regulator with XRE-family HTH domain
LVVLAKHRPTRAEKRPEARLFGMILAELRRGQGLSQQALAEASGYTSNYISLLECGDRAPTLTALLRLAPPLHTSATELVRRVEALQNSREWASAE